MAELKRPGAAFYFTESGPRNAPVVVLGHGLFFTGSLFHYQLDELQQEFRCVSLDWRGHGLTSTRGAFAMNDLVDDLEALLSTFDRPVHYVGHGMGASAVLPLAARRGDLFRSLTLVGASANAEDPDDAYWYLRMGNRYRRLGAWAVRSKLKRALFSEASLRSGRVRRDVNHWAEEFGYPSRVEMRHAMRAFANRRGTQPEATSVAVPTQLVVGEDDVVSPPYRTRRLEELIPGAEVHTIEGAGHAVPLESPHAVTHLVRSFVREVERRRDHRGRRRGKHLSRRPHS